MYIHFQCSPFQAVAGKIYHLKHHLLPPKLAWNCWKWNWYEKEKIMLHLFSQMLILAFIKS